MEFKLTPEQAQRVATYLGQLPYQEVADIIDSLKEQGKTAEDQEETTEE